MTRVRLTTDERRAQLLALGVQLYAQHPYDALTTEAIAARGEISKGLLFHYFGSKRGFYLATLEHVAQQLLTRVQLDPDRAPLDAVGDALDRLLDFVDAHAAIYRALLRGGLGPRSRAAVERVRWTLVHRVRARLDPPGTPLASTPVIDAAGLRLYGWVGTLEALSLAWIDHGVARDEIRALMIDSVASVLAAIEPGEAGRRDRGAAQAG